MSRLTLSTFLAVLLLFPVAGRAACDLQITVSCSDPQAGASSCTSTTLNAGDSSCSGLFYVGMMADVPDGSLVTVTNFSNTLGLSDCWDSTTFPVGVPFALCFGQADLGPHASLTTTGKVNLAGSDPVPVLAFTGVDNPETDETEAFVYASSAVTPVTCTPTISVPPVTQSDVPFTITWGEVSDPATAFTLDEALNADFTSGLTSRTVTGHAAQVTKHADNAVTWYYRVHANSCGGAAGPYSQTASTVVLAPPVPSAQNPDVVVPLGSTNPITFPLFIPGSAAVHANSQAMDTTVTVTSDKPYITVGASTVTVPPGGTTVNVTVNPTGLPPGGNTGTVTATSTATGLPVTTQSVTISLVTPVTPGGKSVPASNSLIIPVVTHVTSDVPWFSDVRLTNATSGTVNYRVVYSPYNADATKASKITTVPVTSNSTVALNDIVKDFFGVGATGVAGDSGYGALEIRPLDTASPLSYASSRAYASTASGTYGQFVAAIPFSKFIGASDLVPLPGQPGPPAAPLLSLQQIAQSDRYRTNIGLVEGSGTPASGHVRLYDDAGTVLKDVPYALNPGQMTQLNLKDLTGFAGNLDDGRLEVTLDGDTGAVTAYASVVDNRTRDPLAIQPVQVSKVSASRFVLPGVGDVNGGLWRSDIRVYNGGTAAATVTPTFYPRYNATPVAGTPFTLQPGQVWSKDNALTSFFNTRDTVGSVVFTTTANTALVTTGRTYATDATTGGTYGQFIPGLTSTEGIGAGDRPLQVLQLEQSQNFRSNVGVVELTGNPVSVELTATIPDSKTSPVTRVDLKANEFRQLDQILKSMNPNSNTYNARISVSVIPGTGSGRVTAYGSVVDAKTFDPTYVPAQ